MTVSTTTSKSGPYAGAGTTGPFTVGFPFLDNSHLKVVKTSTAGVDSTLTLTTDYSVTGAGGASGTVTLVVALAVNEKLTILRNVPETQLADYVPNDPFPAQTHEQALDKLTMIAQQIRERGDRALRLPESETATDAAALLPTVTVRASKFLSWDASGNPIAASVVSSTPVSAFMATVLDDADANSARSTLGLGTISTQSAAAVSITGGSITNITDLTVADGGTGASTFTDGGVLVGNAAGAIQVTSAGTSGQFLKSGGAGVDPAFANIAGPDITSGDIAAARITAALNATGSAPLFACRAWVSFNGTGTVAINASGNVSSVTDNGTGNYQLNFITAIQDANYAVVGQAGKLLIDDATNCLVVGVSSKTVSAMRFMVVDNNSDVATDAADVGIAIFR